MTDEVVVPRALLRQVIADLESFTREDLYEDTHVTFDRNGNGPFQSMRLTHSEKLLKQMRARLRTLEALEAKL
jgi:hypothetical protein